jgi:hypothetical protein
MLLCWSNLALSQETDMPKVAKNTLSDAEFIKSQIAKIKKTKKNLVK